ncbi:TonB-dependent receptor [Polaribacter sp. WD7]|uniref:TonB-dependent receptor n=1 Tax=Polaribacter sp. WD7 TaxID=2269061 RepID=UPI000DF13361|nr:TonB-dependent receptor [Polaribacter sp. WD7]RCS28375.1 TonB-dependent receptor [Polaribacter sp. WD7]
MNKKLNFKNLLLILVMLSSTGLVAQSTISGIVKDTNGNLIPGVNIFLKGTTQGANTDFDGVYEIANVANGSYTIIASYIGYDNFTKEITVNGNLKLNIVIKENAESLDEIIVTGVANPRSKIESSVSITTIKPSVIAQSAPRTTAEIFRTIPGIRSESSGGEGNSNIAVRGVPVSSGGSKYIQLQEDGLPVLLFGDMSFATADIFTRFDNNIGRIEAIRGGSASTVSSNSPGAIINLISKTGKVEGGAIGTTFGLDYDSFRTDFNYGAPIAEGLYFHAGGFYRVGEGLRETGFTANNGGQFKFNLTKEFKNGYVRLNAKLLNDRAVAYLPMPIQVSGTNSNPTWGNAPNFSATRGTSHTPFLTQNVGLGADGQLRRSNVSDGMNPVSRSIGLEASFDLAEGWKIKNNGRFSLNSGSFVSPFPAQVATASDIANSFGAGATLEYTTGGVVPTNSLVSRIHMFDVELNNFNNFMNDFKLSKSFDNVDVTVGYFKSIQNVSMSWLWNSYLQEVSDNNARLIDVFDAANTPLSENGLYAYGTPFWGNLHRNYDTKYNVSAPYASIAIEASETFNIDASIRFDSGKVDGSFAGGTSREFDINNDGVISVPEQNVFAIDNANATTVNYDYNYFSYSLGLNYKLADRQAVFGRLSRGAAAKADRILFSGLDYTNSNTINALDFITQAEFGYKRGFDKGSLYATVFFANTKEEGGFEATTQTIIENDYKSVGLELEGSYKFNDNFGIRAGLTYTNASIESGPNDGNTPRRQPDFIYNFIPTYNFGSNSQNAIGLSLIGQSKAFAQDNNELVMPGFVIVNSFINVGITKSLSANLAANNLFDSLGITESEEGSITENQTNIVRARPVPGRSVSLGLKYNF